MSFVSVQHIFNAFNGLPEDGVVNTFHFIGPPLAQEALLNLAEQVVGFYDGGSGADSIADVIHTRAMAPNRHTVKIYDMNAPRPNPPVFTYTPVAPVPANHAFNAQSWPSELACCLSYRSTPTPGMIAARNRGRIYIGPIRANQAAEDDIQHTNRPAVSLRSKLRLAAVRFKAAAQTDGWSWVGFSPTAAGTSGPVEGEAGVFFIDEFWTDDAWDIQRRRGLARTVVEVTPAG